MEATKEEVSEQRYIIQLNETECNDIISGIEQLEKVASIFCNATIATFVNLLQNLQKNNVK